jgi:hypothetical protein
LTRPNSGDFRGKELGFKRGLASFMETYFVCSERADCAKEMEVELTLSTSESSIKRVDRMGLTPENRGTVEPIS